MVSRSIVFSAFLLCLPINAVAQPIPSPDSLVYAISEMYKDLGQYYFEGDVAIRMRRGRQTQNTNYSLRTAMDLPSGFLIEIGGERARTLVVSDSMTWAYHPSSNQYMKRPGALLPVSLRSDFPDPIRTYARLDLMIESAKYVDPDSSYMLGNEKRPAYLLEIIPKPTEQTAGQSVSMMLWIDKEHHVVLQERKSSYIPNSPYGPMSLRQTTSYSSVLFGSDIPDSLFVFDPPSEADRVTGIEAFPNIPETLYGLKAEDFSLPELSTGEELSLASFAGNVVVLNFWATWCGPCRAEMGALNKIRQEWSDKGLIVIAINEEETDEQVLPYITEEGLDFTVLMDRFGLVSRQYSVYELPTTFIIDRKGTIRAHWIGARHEADFRHGIGKWLD